ncbi:MAG: hypothetical protein JWO13_2755 [Acidobacteriales bacterium]|nr:hypothetical protein [Terriglobales bacterium]
MAAKNTVLILDDDPLHLKLYSWVVNQGGFNSLCTLVKSADLELPLAERIDLAIMDYNYFGTVTALDVARQLISSFPGVPILVLSDHAWLPQDMEPIAAGFVRKGDPELLLQTITSLIGEPRRNRQSDLSY